ncbi:MAG: hypothetical protein JKY12_07545, partial [Sneathiella sp.]|nr:hypothetical protein [Sneathiella sp.]
TAGMGGGTGTGAAPIVAKAARELGILTVGVVTKPFQFEGNHRMRIAEAGIEELQKYVDTLIIIPNQNLFRIANEKTTFADAFNMADDVLHSGVRGVTDLMVMPGLINLDFADVNTVMSEMGKAMMGTGEATGENRAIEAAEAAISNPLLDDVSMKGARGVLINITGGMDLTLYELDEAANRIRSEVDPDANIIVGSTFDATMDGPMRVSVVATGIDAMDHKQQVAPNVTSLLKVNADVAPIGGGRLGGLSAPVIPAASTIAASSFGASIPDNVPTSQPMMSGTDIGEASNFEVGITETFSSDNSLALDLEPDLLSNVEVQMESSERAPASAGESTPHFKAPPAIKVERRTENLVNPDARLSAEEASTPRKKRKGPSLFERMTGVGRMARKAEAEADKASQETAEAPIRREPEPTVRQPQQSAEPQPQKQDAMSASVRIEQKKEDEDLLDIPAFLRRQAN